MDSEVYEGNRNHDVSERDGFRDDKARTEATKEGPEWSLPASHATRESVGMAFDHRFAAKNEELQPRHYTMPDGTVVRLWHREEDNSRNIDISWGDDDPLDMGVRRRFMVDRTGSTEENRSGNFTFLLQPERPDTGEGLVLLKTDWPGRYVGDNPEDVSEGEAGEILETLTEMQELPETSNQGSM